MSKNEVKISITGDASKFSKAAKDADSAMGGVVSSGKKAEGMSKGMSTALLAGGAAAVAFGKKSVSAYMDAGRETMKLARLTGGTAEDMSRLRVVAQQSGVDFAKLTGSITLFSKSLQSAKGSDELKALGVEAKDAAGNTRPYMDLLADLAARFKSMPDGLEKNAAAMKLFGKSGADMVPLLNKGKDGIEELSKKADELGLTFKDTDGVKEQIKAQRDLSLAWQGIQVQVGSVVAPAMLQFATVASTTAKTVAGAFKDIPGPVREVGTAAAGLVGMAALVGGAWSKVKSGLGSFPGIDRLRGQFVTLGADGEKSFTRLGKAAMIGGKLIAAAGISEAIFSISNAARGMDGQMTDAINNTVIAAGKGGKGVVTEFTKAVNVEGSKMSVSGLWERFGTEFRLAGTGVVADIEHIQRSFETLMKTDPKGAQALVDQVREMDKGLDKNSTDYIESEKIIDKWQKSIDAAAGATSTLTGETADTTGEVTEQSKAIEELVTRWKNWQDVVRGTTDPLFAATSASDGLRTSQIAVMNATKDVADAQREHGRNSDEYRAAVDALSAANQAQVVSARDQQLAMAALESSFASGDTTIDKVRVTMQGWVQQGLISQDQMNGQIFKLGLLKVEADKIDGTAVGVNAVFNDAEARAKIDSFLAKVRSVGVFNAIFTPSVNVPAGGGGGASKPKNGQKGTGANAGKTAVVNPSTGTVTWRAAGGLIPGVGNTDSVPAMLTPGEFVIRKDAVKRLGVDAMEQINAGRAVLPGPMPGGGAATAVATRPTEIRVQIGQLVSNDPRAAADVLKAALQDPTVQAEVRRALGIFN